ncbi:MAG: hypothetical protein JO345_21755 [Streptosporangiaceae bacterium]|nr:hypothetical protein [Streptosporangiaceae bacterium]
MRSARAAAILIAAITATAAVTLTGPAASASGRVSAPRPPGQPNAARATVSYPDLRLPDGRHALVYSDGLAEVSDSTGNRVEFTWVPLLNPSAGTSLSDSNGAALPGKGQLIADLLRPPSAPFAAQEVVVIYRDATPTAPVVAASPQVPGPGAAPRYTDKPALNTVLARLGVDRASRLFTGLDTQQLNAGHPALDLSRAVVLHLTAASVPAAVTGLRADADVAYAAPDWIVSTSYTPPEPAGAPEGPAPASRVVAPAASTGVPQNYALTSSAQALLNRPGVDEIPAYTSIEDRYGQLPGQGETITNVSLGTLDDASAVANASDPCHSFATTYGPTTEMIGGQRYLDWPSMPLIPAYTASQAGQLNPAGETCGADDPTLTEVGLDFSMMAPLPHNLQRPDALGSGLTDLLGIAPGASYRLVIPATPGGAITDVDAALLAAASQNPRPDVITASLSFGFDADGFSSRYLEDDPVTEAVIAAIVHNYKIVVCVSGGDGLRTSTNASVPPSGGSAATDTVPPGGTPASLDDIDFSSAPSADFDSGAIDVGATTLDDITSAQPQDPANAALVAQHAFPITRYDGFRLFASAYGSRVNVAAPGDNVLGFSHAMGQAADVVQVNRTGGTSASAPEVAAAAAIVLQVARLTADGNVAGNPLAVRQFLERTGTAVPLVPQSDVDNTVGPQIDIGNAVSTLLAGALYHPVPSVPRVAVEQRQNLSALTGSIQTATDPGAISLSGRLLRAWITIAPDWVGLPSSGVRYQLTAAGGPGTTLATTPWARLQPSQLLAAAGEPVVATVPRTVSLSYTASVGGRTLATATVALTFGPSDGTSLSTLAPIVPAVSNGPVIPVRYDLSGVSPMTNPVLVVSEPGRVDPATGLFFHTAYSTPVTALSGTINVPVPALPGAGIYGIGIQSSPGGATSTDYTAFAFTRVTAAGSSSGSAPPAPPTLSYQGSASGHSLTVPYHASFQVSYDVSGVSGADAAMLEVSAAGPTAFNNYNPFNNPNGSERDDDGADFGSVSYVRLPATHGTATVNSGALGLYPTMNHVVRVIPVRGDVAVGEASGVSSVSMNGVQPADGGNLANGFGINANGTDGFLTSNQVTAAGKELGSVETFDQRSNAIVSTTASSSDTYGTPSGGCPGIFAGDVGVYEDTSATSDTFKVLNPVAGASGAPGTAGVAGTAGTWTPPGAGPGAIVCPAPNQATSDTAVITGSGGARPTYEVMTSNVAGNTFSAPTSLSPALASFGVPFAGGFDQNTTTGQAVVAITDFDNLSGPSTIVTADLASHALASFPAVTTGQAMGLAVDSATNLAVSPGLGSNGIGIYDLANHTGTFLALGGGPYEHPAVDQAHAEFAVQEIAGPDFYGQTSNNNAMSSVITANEDGTGIQRIEKFNFFNVFLLDFGGYVQLNPASRSAYTLGPGAGQLFPFSY